MATRQQLSTIGCCLPPLVNARVTLTFLLLVCGPHVRSNNCKKETMASEKKGAKISRKWEMLLIKEDLKGILVFSKHAPKLTSQISNNKPSIVVGDVSGFFRPKHQKY